MALFLDSNALAKRYITEKGSLTVTLILARPELTGGFFVAEHLEPEVVSALAKKVREGRLAEDGFRVAVREFYRSYPDLFNVVPLTREILGDAARLIVVNPARQLSASDALHLAAARYVARTVLTPHDPLTVMTSDRQVENEATALGFQVFNPERDPVDLLLGS